MFMLGSSVDKPPYEVAIERNGLEATTNRINKVITCESAVEAVVHLVEFTYYTKARELAVLNFIFGLLRPQPQVIDNRDQESHGRKKIAIFVSSQDKKRPRLEK